MNAKKNAIQTLCLRYLEEIVNQIPPEELKEYEKAPTVRWHKKYLKRLEAMA